MPSPSPYGRWVTRWENRLAGRDKNRVVRPFAWGLEWLGLEQNGADPGSQMAEHAAWAVAHSEEFFSYQTPRDYRLQGTHLTFTSPLATPYPENNTVHAELFPSRRHQGRAVVVLPQWNAGETGHAGLCRLLSRFGVTALRMSLAYHGRRKPAETERADYHVSSNVGRTVHAGRQSVVDTRACLDWLAAQGYRRLGVLGTSLGSCVAFIAAVHDTRVSAMALNHVSTWFGDVIWTGLSTRHVRHGLAGHLSQDELRRYWAAISPASYFERLCGRNVAALLVWARYDTTFLPELSRQVVGAFRTLGIPHREVTLPCGHYTTGEFPFKLLDGLALCNFLRSSL